MDDKLTPSAREILSQAGALLEGHFVLSSGKHSPYYVQCAQLFAQPRLARLAAGELASKLDGLEIDWILSPAMGGVIAGYELAAALGVSAMFCERPSGTFELRRGFELRPGLRVLIVEDVITTGGSALETAELARSHGAQIAGFASFINRGQGAFQPPEPYFFWTELDAPVHEPSQCPQCAGGSEPQKPGSRQANS